MNRKRFRLFQQRAISSLFKSLLVFVLTSFAVAGLFNNFDVLKYGLLGSVVFVVVVYLYMLFKFLKEEEVI